MMLRRTVHFAGRVQGVGFRYTVARLAEQHAVAGYVQNLPDGQVRLVMEGEQEAQDTLLKDIRRHFARHIAAEQQEESPATGEFGAAAPGALSIRH